jgi:nucleoside-diphosphate-sugar epimerase
VQDLSDLYVLLAEAAAAGGSKATWNEDGYYFAENGEFVWKDMFQEMARIAQKMGLLDSNDTPSLSTTELAEIHPYGVLIWCSNSRGKAIRARKLLGWKPHRESLKELLPSIIDEEAKALGLIQGHAAKVTQ